MGYKGFISCFSNCEVYLDLNIAVPYICDLTFYIHNVKMNTMNTEMVNIRATADTRRKLKLLAAMLGKNMMETLVKLIDEALEKQKQNANPESV